MDDTNRDDDATALAERRPINTSSGLYRWLAPPAADLSASSAWLPVEVFRLLEGGIPYPDAVNPQDRTYVSEEEALTDYRWALERLAVPDPTAILEVQIFDQWVMDRRSGRTPDVEALVRQLPEERRPAFIQMLRATAALQLLAGVSPASAPAPVPEE